jgi:hypothetical protein
VHHRLFLYVLALWKEASEHDCTRHSQALVAKVSFSHEGLHGDWLARCFFTTESDLQKRQTVRNNGESAIINEQLVTRKAHLGCRMILLSLDEAISQTLLDRQTLLSERSKRHCKQLLLSNSSCLIKANTLINIA